MYCYCYCETVAKTPHGPLFSHSISLKYWVLNLESDIALQAY